MKKKIILQMAVLFVCCANVFALLLPNGDNVRVSDVKQKGDAIIEAVLSQEAKITTSLGKLPAKGTVYFYESGAIKSLKLPKDTITTIESPIGTLFISTDNYNSRDNKLIEFYESGCPKHIYLVAKRGENANYVYPTITVNGITGKCRGDIYFWDSKNPNEWICKELQLAEDITVAVNNTNIVVPGEYENKITFYSNGQFEYISNIDAPTETFKTPIGDVWLKDNSSLSFYEDGSIKGFCTDELLQVKLDNRTFNIPGGEYVYLYKNGVPGLFKASNEQTVKVLKRTYNLPAGCKYLFSKEGKIKGFSTEKDSSWIVESFYTDGNFKMVIYYEFYGRNIIKGTPAFYTNQGEKKAYYSDFGKKFEVKLKNTLANTLFSRILAKAKILRWFILVIIGNQHHIKLTKPMKMENMYMMKMDFPLLTTLRNILRIVIYGKINEKNYFNFTCNFGAYACFLWQKNYTCSYNGRKLARKYRMHHS